MSIELIAMMLLGAIVLALVAVAIAVGLGVYLGWFNIGAPDNADKGTFRFTMDADRTHEDKQTD